MDFIISHMQQLEVLNQLPVEREDLENQEEDEDEDDPLSQPTERKKSPQRHEKHPKEELFSGEKIFPPSAEKVEEGEENEPDLARSEAAGD